MELNEKTLEREDKFKGRVLTVHVDKVGLVNGKTSTREVVDHPGGVTVAALTDRNELLFVRQYRYPYHKVIMELPAGKLEVGEEHFEAVKRELKEETGCEGKDWEFFGDLYPSPGYCGEIIRLWFCRVADRGEMNLDEDEFLEVEKIPLREAVDMVMRGEIEDSKTQALVLRVARKLGV
ncbi:MAG: NUDIX hydrolase [Lachnospiraceae bacterium]|nr:NUDIX hydrolase [Lachnospiraceae bacterium]